MNIEVEELPNCLKILRVEVPSDKVLSEWDGIAREFCQQAKLPGFRPGKAPRPVVEKRYQKEIQEEVTRRLLSESTREAIREKDLNVLSISKVENVEFADDRSLRFAATVITSPEFVLPECKGLSLKVGPTEVTEAEIDGMIGRLREQSADFEDVTGRGVEIEDYAVIDYRGTVDGKPVSEVAPRSGRSLSESNGFWLRMLEDSFIPGFCPNVAGLKPGDSKEFDLAVAEDFPFEELRGRTIHFAVTLKGIKRQVLPEIDDSLAAKIMPGKTLAELRDTITRELKQQKEANNERTKRDQAMRLLLEQVNFELPASYVRDETRRALQDIVRENQMRGVKDDELAEHRDELIQGAEQGARNRLKGSFLLLKIAEKEGLKVEPEDMSRRIAALAQRHRMAPDKLLKELQKRDALDQVREEVLTAKALDFVISNASVHEVAAGDADA